MMGQFYSDPSFNLYKRRFMIRALNVAERNVSVNPAVSPITISAAVSKEVIPNQRINPFEEISYRYIQNVGTEPVYYAFGSNASPTNYHGILNPAPSAGYGGSQLDCSNHRLSVSVYATNGTTIVICIIFRNQNPT